MNSFEKSELYKPLYDLVFQRGADFEIRVFIDANSTFKDFDIYDYIRERQDGCHVLIIIFFSLI